MCIQSREYTRDRITLVLLVIAEEKMRNFRFARELRETLKDGNKEIKVFVRDREGEGH